MNFRVLPEADGEAISAALWYEDRQPGLAGCWFDLKSTMNFLRHEGHAILALLLLVPHFAAVYALLVRRGAVPLAIGTMIVIYVASVVTFEFARLGPSSIYILTLILLAISAGCHVLILKLIPRIAARS